MSSQPDEAFAVRLRRRIKDAGNGLCVGIDPPLDGLPPFFQRELASRGSEAYLDQYTSSLLNAAAKIAPAVKFQSAYFEAHGAAGFSALARGLAYAKKLGLLTILDAKRGDISTTMAAYGVMAFKALDADALTVTPYMGLDVLEPLLPWLKTGRGVYVVWITSNPSGALLQETSVGDHQNMAERLLDAFAGFTKKHHVGIGLVLGATKVDHLAQRTWGRLDDMPLLMPGVGAQGGTVTPRIKDMIARVGTVLVPLSRGVAEFPVDCNSWQSYETIIGERMQRTAADLRCD